MIHIKQIKTGRCVLEVEDDHDTGGMIDLSIEVSGAREEWPESQRLDVVVLGVPYVGIIGAKVCTHTSQILMGRTDALRIPVGANTFLYDYTIRLVAVEGYDYSPLITSPWS